MRPRPHPRPFRAALLGGAAVALLAGCEAGQFGHSGRDAEWQRRGAFGVVSASPERAVVSALGQPVAIEPPPGFCVDAGSIETSDRSAVVLVGDCVLEGAAGAMPGGNGELELPPGFTVITGETGAGKSILVDALCVALGGRASSDVIRNGAESAEVEALFDISTGRVIAGSLTRRETRLVVEWILKHRDDLMRNWELAASGRPTFRIEGLADE